MSTWGNYLKSCLEGERKIIVSKCLNVIQSLTLLLIEKNDWRMWLYGAAVPSYRETKSTRFNGFLEAASPSVGKGSYETTHHYLGLLSRTSQGIDAGLASRVLSRFSQEWKRCSRQTVEIPGDQSIEWSRWNQLLRVQHDHMLLKINRAF